MPIYGGSGVSNVVDSQTLHQSRLPHLPCSVDFLPVFWHTSLVIQICETLCITVAVSYVFRRLNLDDLRPEESRPVYQSLRS